MIPISRATKTKNVQRWTLKLNIKKNNEKFNVTVGDFEKVSSEAGIQYHENDPQELKKKHKLN